MARGGMHGGGVHGRGACMARGHAWHGGGACVADGCVWQGGMHGWGGMHGSGQILRDTANERAVRILLECILVHDVILKINKDLSQVN